jgi:hypothetical protein
MVSMRLRLDVDYTEGVLMRGGYSICLLKCETRCRSWPVRRCR